MEFKFRAIDDIQPPSTTSCSHSTDLPLSMDGCFSGFRAPSTTEALRRREIEKEQIRREILRRLELEEEVRRELAMEGVLGGISMQRPLSFQDPLWTNSTLMNPVAVASQTPLIMAPTEMKHSPQISDNDKVTVLAKPDPSLYSTKRKAETPSILDDEPSAFDLKKKSKEEWSCELCQIKATCESGLNAHLNGKKHKAKEERQKRKVHRSNKACIALETMNETVAAKVVPESNIHEEKLEETVADNGTSVTESKNEEKLVKMMVDNTVTESENEKHAVEKTQNISCLALEKKEDTAVEEEGKISALTKRRKVERLWCEICKIGTFSPAVMEGHKKGKKHIKKMKNFEQKSTSCSKVDQRE